ncbi:MAG: HAD family hydrolase [Bacteroidetes bacterium]|nr:HAD family hydrolase [Bacteroidota bacterium]
MKTIIWDWNGTLLNDLDFCITTINTLLEKRNLTLLNHQTYKEVFSFPVKDYYQTIGFDFSKEEFAIPAREFIDLYDGDVKNCNLHESAIEILSHFQKKGTRQFVLSAMKQNMLEQTLKHNSIFNFFEGVFGLDNHYAVSKIERGKQLLSEFNIEKDKSWIIGDTNHDFEVAEHLGIKCILVSDGHQSEERLKDTGAVVISELNQLKSHTF